MERSSVDDAGLRIGDVAERLGVSASTVRLWEARFGAAAPARTGGGHRRYRDRDVAQLAALKELIERGHRPGEAVRALTAGDGASPDLVLATCRSLLRATNVAAVREVLERFVRSLGAETTADVDGPEAVPLDLSFGDGAPVVPSAPRGSVTRLQVERALPPILDDARIVVGWLRRGAAG